MLFSEHSLQRASLAGGGNFPEASMVRMIVHPLVRCIAAHGVDVFVKSLFQVNQRALALAIVPLLERGKHDGAVGFHQSPTGKRFRLMFCSLMTTMQPSACCGSESIANTRSAGRSGG